MAEMGIIEEFKAMTKEERNATSMEKFKAWQKAIAQRTFENWKADLIKKIGAEATEKLLEEIRLALPKLDLSYIDCIGFCRGDGKTLIIPHFVLATNYCMSERRAKNKFKPHCQNCKAVALETIKTSTRLKKMKAWNHSF